MPAAIRSARRRAKCAGARPPVQSTTRKSPTPRLWERPRTLAQQLSSRRPGPDRSDDSRRCRQTVGGAGIAYARCRISDRKLSALGPKRKYEPCRELRNATLFAPSRSLTRSSGPFLPGPTVRYRSSPSCRSTGLPLASLVSYLLKFSYSPSMASSCPLTSIAARYTDDRRANFDIYLPEWLARHNKAVFGALYVAGILVADCPLEQGQPMTEATGRWPNNAPRQLAQESRRQRAP